MEDVKRIPYGVYNFVGGVEQNQYYVDKTMCLPLLEAQPSNLFIIRPCRFGQSIFLSMLHAYYDIIQKEKFQKRFGNLWIDEHPTFLQGTELHCIVMQFCGWELVRMECIPES